MQRLIQQAATLTHLNQRLAKLLPEPLAQHCQIAALQQNTLIIMASSSAWATRLRLQQSKIIKGFKDIPIQSLNIQIKPEVNDQPQATQRRHVNMSPQTSKLLIELSETTSDPKLKQALRRLSQRARNQP
jgi:hypothetical protein